MMKKLLPVLFLLIISLTACTAQKSSLNFDFAESIGQNLEQTCNNLGINEEDLQASKLHGRYDFSEQVEIESENFVKYLLFEEADTSILYGGGYECHLTQPSDHLSKIVASLKNTLNNTYGDPTTYPGLVNVIGDTTDFSNYSNQTLVEDWQDGENYSIRLTVTIAESTTVQVEYKIAP